MKAIVVFCTLGSTRFRDFRIYLSGSYLGNEAAPVLFLSRIKRDRTIKGSKSKMQSNDEFTITSKQLTFIIIGTMLGTGIMNLPRLAAKDAGQDAWFAVILGSLFPLASLSLIRFLYKNNSTGFVNVCRKVSGGFLGSIFSAMLALYSIFAAAIFLRNFIELASMFLLIETPIFVQMVLMLAACAYLALGNAKILGRVNEFFFYVLFPLFLFSLPAVVKNFDIRNLMPVFNHKISDYASGLQLDLPFPGLSFILFSIPMYQEKKKLIVQACTDC